MKEEMIFTRQSACQCLGVSYNASIEEIKKAYREKVKCYHPDANPQIDTTQIYVMIQKAYEYLLQNPYMPYPNSTTVVQNQSVMHAFRTFSNESAQTTFRPMRVFGNDAKVTSQYQKQKQVQKEREKVRQWEAEKRKKAEQTKDAMNVERGYTKEVSKEEELLQRIKAIWIAENIKRQVALEKERIEAENKRKLYRAFMQQKMHQDEINIQNDTSNKN